MNIILDKAGKKFNRDWIFRNLSATFTIGNQYAITGPNGSGKSTLLQVLAGSMGTSSGNINWQTTKPLPHEEVHKYISITAPYLDIIEEMTATEFLQFHKTFKPFIDDISISEILQLVDLSHAADKQIRFYSSGMKQRVKLAQAIFAAAPVLLLDEPCTNLDAKGYELYNNLISKFCSHKLIVVSSNDINEYSFCKEKISIMEFK